MTSRFVSRRRKYNSSSLSPVNSKPTRIKKRLFLILFLIVALVVYTVYPYFIFVTRTLKVSIVKTLFTSGGLHTVAGQINFIILGVPGGDHDGPDLTDSILVANYDIKKNRLVTIGIPRDVWSGALQDKINSAYAYGKAKGGVKGGIALAKAEVGAIVGMPIQYAVVVNFDGFHELIDTIGGVDITIDRTYTDHKFPVPGRADDTCGKDIKDVEKEGEIVDALVEYPCRFETVTFQSGNAHMDGATALKFVRSRNAEGIEGSDFARSQRQQKVLDGMQHKIIKLVKSRDIGQMSRIYTAINSIVERDVDNQQMASLVRTIFVRRNFYQKNFHLDRDLFIVPDLSVYGRYVLVPEKGQNSIHSHVSCLLDKEDQAACK